jgi:alpha-N-arabinofuranosidase
LALSWKHLGRAIYEGIYDPGSKLSDSNGFRKDVMDEVRRLGVPIMRYPAEILFRDYNWLGRRRSQAGRPRVLDKAWNFDQHHQFGTNEFMAWCQGGRHRTADGPELGTGTAEHAAALWNIAT